MVVNGKTISLETLQDKTLLGLLTSMNLSEKRVAVEINGKIIKKTEYTGTKLQSEDIIELIHFAGGG
ncbi:MAG: sulfur carrier protein ThiS [Leptospiraceae bacterium]|nr:sulfur carrier protein ThiS [Leptospiraceae bacterium]MCB1200450.1 sulfur carrier protein ThiS [Leptospiraceae bacterium]